MVQTQLAALYLYFVSIRQYVSERYLCGKGGNYKPRAKNRGVLELQDSKAEREELVLGLYRLFRDCRIVSALARWRHRSRYRFGFTCFVQAGLRWTKQIGSAVTRILTSKAQVAEANLELRLIRRLYGLWLCCAGWRLWQTDIRFGFGVAHTRQSKFNRSLQRRSLLFT